jgi:hypothetical protein
MGQEAVANPLRSIPLAVLSHGQPFGVPADALGFSPEVLERVWAAGQTELVPPMPGTRYEIAAESGHYIQLAQPDLVIEAIQQVVEAVRDPASRAAPASPSLSPTPS